MSDSEITSSILTKETTATEVDLSIDSDSKNSVTSKTVCKFCVQLEAKYTCPRCNLSYCSVKCYQSEKHAFCSEAFYKECVIDELKEKTSNNEERQRVLEMLAKDLEEREEQEDLNVEEDETTDDDLAERLEGLDIDKDISVVWSRLNSKEKEEFARMLQDGRLARLIELWTPWWILKENHKLVCDSKEQDSTKAVPVIYSDTPDITSLLKNSKPSSNCRFDILSIIIAYAFVTRLHNGGHIECAVDSTQDLIDSCMVLKDSYNFSSVGEAVQKTLDQITKKSKDDCKSVNFNINLLRDAKMIISGPGKNDSETFMSSALSEVLKLLRMSYNIFKKNLKDRKTCAVAVDDYSNIKTLKSTIFKAEKKVTFLLSWLHCFGKDMHLLNPLVQFEIETRESELLEVENLKTEIEKNMDKLKPQETKRETSTKEKPTFKKIVELD